MAKHQGHGFLLPTLLSIPSSYMAPCRFPLSQIRRDPRSFISPVPSSPRQVQTSPQLIQRQPASRGAYGSLEICQSPFQFGALLNRLVRAG